MPVRSSKITNENRIINTSTYHDDHISSYHNNTDTYLNNNYAYRNSVQRMFNRTSFYCVFLYHYLQYSEQ